jgi:hypothetical protein
MFRKTRAVSKNRFAKPLRPPIGYATETVEYRLSCRRISSQRRAFMTIAASRCPRFCIGPEHASPLRN